MGEVIAVEVDGIPVAIDNSKLGKVKSLKLMGKIRSEDTNDFDRTIAAIDFAEIIFGAEQFELVCKSLDDSGDPSADVLVQFLFDALNAAADEKAAEAKN